MPEESDNAASQPATTTAAPPPADSSPASTPAPAATTPAEPSVDDIVANVVKAHEEPASQPAPEGKEESDAYPVSTTEEKKAGEEEQPASVEAKEGPVPYSRFKEVNEKAHTYEQELTASKPLIEAAKTTNEFLQRHGITQEEYQDTLDTLVLLKTDPRAALEKIKPLMQQLGQYDPNALPSELEQKIAKLNERVEEGELSKTAAKELEEAWREKAKFDAERRLGAKRGELTEAQRQQAQLQSITTAASQWDVSKRTSDPDYKPKAKPDEPDGLFEITRKGFMYELGQTQVRSPQDAVNLLEKAYTDAKRLFTTRLAPKPTKPSPNSTSSSTTPRKEPSTDDEIVADVLRQHGIVYVPRVLA